MQVDPLAKVCHHEGAVYAPTAMQWRLILYLSTYPGHVKSRDQILDAIYPRGYPPSSPDAVVSHVKEVRKGFRKAFGRDDWLVTRHGLGYVWSDI